MKFFRAFGDNLDYKDIIQLDGAFSVTHANYGRTPLFNGRVPAVDSIEEIVPSVNRAENAIDNIRSFNGTRKRRGEDDRESLWKNF